MKILRELHIVSGLHPDWPFEYYVDVIKMLKKALPHIHLKAFTAVEITYFAKISGKSIEEVLTELHCCWTWILCLVVVRKFCQIG